MKKNIINLTDWWPIWINKYCIHGSHAHQFKIRCDQNVVCCTRGIAPNEINWMNPPLRNGHLLENFIPLSMKHYNHPFYRNNKAERAKEFSVICRLVQSALNLDHPTEKFAIISNKLDHSCLKHRHVYP